MLTLMGCRPERGGGGGSAYPLDPVAGQGLTGPGLESRMD
jgi:hypothetical protein